MSFEVGQPVALTGAFPEHSAPKERFPQLHHPQIQPGAVGIIVQISDETPPRFCVGFAYDRDDEHFIGPVLAHAWLVESDLSAE